MPLSKSDYMLYLRHPAWLWLKKHDKAKLPPVDEATQAMFDTGHLFEAYAEQRFPGALRLGFSGYAQYLSLPLSTKQALLDGATTIFQGRFEQNDITCICDIVTLVDKNTLDLYEIKASTKVKPEHELDLAFQLVVLEACGYTVRNIAVIHVNNQYVLQGDVDALAITSLTDVTEVVKAQRATTQATIQQALATAKSSVCPSLSPALCGLDSLKDWLAIYRTLTPVEECSIFDLYMLTPTQIKSFEEQGITKLLDIPDDFPLSDRQQRQVSAVRRNELTVDREKVGEFMDELTYPLYFLDYETLAGVVPAFDGTRPYQQIPFQYSLHVLDYPGSELKHFEYLHSDVTNPIPDLTQALQQQIGETGSVIAWNAKFEKGRNTDMGKIYPEYAEFYEGLNDRIVDLMIPFANGWHHHKDFNGSASIKNVLPVLVPELSYKDLGVQDGTTAQRLWMEAILDGKRDNQKTQILNDLREYCKLDTLAMVRIYEHLRELCANP